MSTLLIVALLVDPPSSGDLPTDVFARAPGAVDAAFERFLAIVGKDEHTSTAWQAESAAAEKLVAFGFPAAHRLKMEAEDEAADEVFRLI